MFRYRMSGCDPADDPTYEERLPVAMAAYSARLESFDLSRAGDLLLFFGGDFFHDAQISTIRLADEGRSVYMELEAWLDAEDDPNDELPGEIGFQVRFDGVAWCQLRRDPALMGDFEFLYSEIDGLEDEIATAVGEYGGEFHSLTIECDEGWIALVFRSVMVVPNDPILWARVMRDPRAKLHLYGVGPSS